MKQLPIDLHTTGRFNKEVTKQLRLGKWVEEFVLFQLEQNTSVGHIIPGLQIQGSKTTIGELDVIFEYNTIPIHLEIVYKFYLYDPKLTSQNPLAHWIGPNRNDTLLFKLTKLRDQQLPLMYHPLSQQKLQEHNLNGDNIEQFVVFKAQLYTPYHMDFKMEGTLNPSCLKGQYINVKALNVLKSFQIYIPDKLEWLISPTLRVSWLDYTKAKVIILQHIHNKRSPLIWAKDHNSVIKSYFITWW